MFKTNRHRLKPLALLGALWLLFSSNILTSLYAQQLSQENVEESQRWKEKMISYGLIDIQKLDSTIIVDLKYSTTDNFVGEDLYGSFNKAFLQQHFAEKVAKANFILKDQYPYYTIIIYDAARPQSVQSKMHSLVRGTPNAVYVASPYRGGRHNYGVAVDLSIVDRRTGKALDMGTSFDFFGSEAHVGRELDLVRLGKISFIAMRNREILYSIMSKVNLFPYRREWWHYEERMSMNKVRSQFQLLSF